MVVSRRDQIVLLGQCVMIVLFLLLCMSYILSAGELLWEVLWKKQKMREIWILLISLFQITFGFICYDIGFPLVSTDKIRTSLNFWAFYKDSLFSHSCNLNSLENWKCGSRQISHKRFASKVLSKLLQSVSLPWLSYLSFCR